jgi:hypothetical protein
MLDMGGGFQKKVCLNHMGGTKPISIFSLTIIHLTVLKWVLPRLGAFFVKYIKQFDNEIAVFFIQNKPGEVNAQDNTQRMWRLPQ